MLPTPSTSHLSFTNIYEPSEDSYLLLDTLSSAQERHFLATRFSHPTATATATPLILEVGVGSGVVLAFLAANATHIFHRGDVVALGTDVNPFACREARRTVLQALERGGLGGSWGGGAVGCLVGDLAGAVKAGCVDVLVFNPPYVPTEAFPSAPVEGSGEEERTAHDGVERDAKLLELSYAGGADGMETTDRLLSQLPDLLSGRGVAYVLFCAQNKPLEVAARIRAWAGDWSAEMVGSSGKQAGWEKLSIMRIWRGHDAAGSNAP